jgi:hypothetical protein
MPAFANITPPAASPRSERAFTLWQRTETVRRRDDQHATVATPTMELDWRTPGTIGGSPVPQSFSHQTGFEPFLLHGIGVGRRAFSMELIEEVLWGLAGCRVIHTITRPDHRIPSGQRQHGRRGTKHGD